ncbi:2-oxo acid dehydrogenase subunit E2 [Shewanella canadensis]|uniref:Dihydrolipoamide acetyltransferase component of pyruvate dehydrogenase complex n=2 Tax=Shewanella canadensis TaxID=271096 RepID=A0A3S0J6G7_9GAMM|nr:2-oxo acid dehydrogenase subunit E2 [Shewanella canadensis]
MPSLGADMTEGILVEWLVKCGDPVKRGDIIAVIETQKGAIDMEVYHTGVISEILHQPIVTLPVGTVMARVKLTEHSDRSKVTQLDSVAVTQVETRTPLASPVVRKVAMEQKLDLTAVRGSGPQGAILLRDLPETTEEMRASTQASKQSSGATKKMRGAIASAMTKSKNEIPHFYQSLDIELGNAQEWLKKTNEYRSPDQHILLLALLLKAAAKALTKYPDLNGFYENNQFVHAEEIHIGNVISLRQGGLVVPAIHHVDKLSVDETMQAIRDISARGRNGHLRSSELTDATITITNMGERGTDTVFAVIYPPQVAIIGFGKIREKLQLVEGDLVNCDVMSVCLSADHRVIDGMLGAKFLNALSKQLQKPELL